MSKPSIFLSVSDGPNCAHIIKEFQRIGYEVHSGDMSDNTIGEQLADHFIKLPPQDADEYPETILDYVNNNEIDYFVPLVGTEALRMVDYREDFEDLNCVLVAANKKTLQKSVDTVELLQFMDRETNIPIMDFEPFESKDQYLDALENLQANELCVKPAEGSGTRGFCILDDSPQNAEDVFSKKQRFQRMKYSELKEILKESETVPKLMLMEFLTGQHYDCNIICKDGNIHFQSIKTRDDSTDGTITRGKIIRNDRIEELNRTIAEALNVTGLICTQFIGDHLIEINPRWSTSLNYDSIHEYRMGLEVCAGRDVSVDSARSEDYVGVKMIRYWDLEIFKE